MGSISIIGAGAWGTALAIHAARAGHAVVLWARDPSSPGRRLPGAVLPAEVRVRSGLPGAGADQGAEADALLLAVPAQHLRAVAAQLHPAVPVVVCAKGVETGTGLLPLEVLAEVRPNLPAAVLTGPNFAHEVAAGLPAASVVASADAALRDTLLRLLGTPAFRLYGNADAIGAQLGGAAKNVIAIAAGAVVGARLGENARAALVTRGLAELGRLAAALGGQANTVAGLSGLGDLLLTCTGRSSRNFRFGHALGEGASVAEAMGAAGGTVEGAATAPALLLRALRAGLAEDSLPVCAAVAALLAGNATLEGTVAALLSRPQREEGAAGDAFSPPCDAAAGGGDAPQERG